MMTGIRILSRFLAPGKDGLPFVSPIRTTDRRSLPVQHLALRARGDQARAGEGWLIRIGKLTPSS
ncbi:hypothetical protein SAMN05519105_3718 [Rhodobacter sp. 24-YEA-8]|nr:hypothetical protein SAMN05519105_3718 [Rhodobacter sp. 24-YEA-8]